MLGLHVHSCRVIVGLIVSSLTVYGKEIGVCCGQELLLPLRRGASGEANLADLM